MDSGIVAALSKDLTIDIVTTGRRTGRKRRTEIWFHRIEGRYFITGTPGRRDWYANLSKTPRFLFCLKESAKAELQALAVPVTDTVEKRRLLLAATSVWQRPDEATVDRWVTGSPMVEVRFLP